MSFRLITTSILIAVLSTTSVSAAKWGTVKGQFVFDGNIPNAKKITATKDAQVCGKGNLVEEELVVDPKSKGIKNVVATVYLKSSGKIDVHPDYAKTAKDKIRLDNIGCRFEPHVVSLRTTQTLVIGNKDSVGHNSMITAFKNDGINPMIPANKEQEARFELRESVPAKVSCSIHPWMQAHLVIKDHPYVSITDKDGKFELKNLPAGKLTLEFWQEKKGRVDEFTRNGKKEKHKRGRIKFTVKEGMNDFGVIKLSADSFKKKK